MANISARVLDSEQNFNGSADPMITADRGFIQFLCPDFGFWLLGSSIVDLNAPLETLLSLFYVPGVVQWRKGLEIVRHLSLKSLLFLLVSARFSFDTDVGFINISSSHLQR